MLLLMWFGEVVFHTVTAYRDERMQIEHFTSGKWYSSGLDPIANTPVQSFTWWPSAQLPLSLAHRTTELPDSHGC